MQSNSFYFLSYLRTKRFPHMWCPGCGIGIVMGSIVRAVYNLQLNKNEVTMVSGIGCSGRISGYCDFNTLHTTHGRALTFATGMKLANPHLNIIVIMGDGDALAIGGNHFIHAARRNINLTSIVINNWLYGMTGGQHSPVTPLKKITTTTPYGQYEPLFDTAQLAVAAGATYVARGTTYHVKQLDKLIIEGMEKKGFGLVEIISQCPTSFGRLNKMGSAVEMMKWQKNHTISVNKAQEMSQKELKDKVITGVFANKRKKEYTKAYDEIITKIKLK